MAGNDVISGQTVCIFLDTRSLFLERRYASLIGHVMDGVIFLALFERSFKDLSGDFDIPLSDLCRILTSPPAGGMNNSYVQSHFHSFYLICRLVEFCSLRSSQRQAVICPSNSNEKFNYLLILVSTLVEILEADCKVTMFLISSYDIT